LILRSLFFSLFFITCLQLHAQNAKTDSLLQVKAGLQKGVFSDDSTRLRVDFSLIQMLHPVKHYDSVLVMHHEVESYIQNRIRASKTSSESGYFTTQLALLKIILSKVKTANNEYNECLELVSDARKILESQFENTDSTVREEAYRVAAFLSLTQGVQFIKEKRNHQAIQEIKDGLQLATNCDCPKEKVNLHNSIGVAYKKNGALDQALDHYFMAIDIATKAENFSILTMLYSNVGIIYKNIKDFDKAEEFYKKSLSYRKHVSDIKSIADLYGNLGILAKNRKDYITAIQFYDTSYLISDSISYTLGMISALTNRSSIHKENKEYDKAIDNLKLAERLTNETSDKSRNFHLYNELAILYIKKQQLNHAKQYVDIVVELAYKFDNFHEKAIAHSLQSYYYELKKDFKRALEHHKIFQRFNDSIFNENAQNNLIAKDLEFSFEQQRYADSLQNEFIQAAKEKETVAEIEKRDLQIKSSRIQLIIVGIALLLILILSYIIFKRLRITTKQKSIIEEQKDKLANKNEEIEQSVTYAKKIQDTILPSHKLIKRFIDKFFVIYLPKDIVSGDFYWATETKDYFYISVADCTGHGVPGAMVSFVCSKALSQAVNEEGLTETDAILNRTREIVIQQFDQTENSLNDGMDLALLRFDKIELNLSGEKKIQFSSANSPLWIITEASNKAAYNLYPTKQFGTQLLIEIKGDKMPIGKFVNMQPFSKQLLTVSAGDNIYLLTDGYADQFGGDNNKKFKSAKLKSIIAKNSKETKEQQHEALLNTLKNWMKDQEQVDDITVIGLKIN
jgi:serine phosphatase RsbU (regulator of sigma subunit)